MAKASIWLLVSFLWKMASFPQLLQTADSLSTRSATARRDGIGSKGCASKVEERPETITRFPWLTNFSTTVISSVPNHMASSIATTWVLGVIFLRISLALLTTLERCEILLCDIKLRLT